MPAQNIHVIKEDFKNLQEASEAFAILQKQFRYMQEHIDVENIIAKSLTAAVIKAGAITADEMTVDKLSAITADMGKLTSGEIYGAYIATKEADFPRTEMSSTGDLFGAYASAVNFIKILASEAGDPLLYFENAVALARVALIGNTLSVGSFGNLSLGSTGDMSIESTGASSNISIKPGSSGQVRFPSWDKLFSTLTSKTLQQTLDAKATSGSSTGTGGSANGGIPIGTVLMVNGGGTVTWNGIPSHTHPQT